MNPSVESRYDVIYGMTRPSFIPKEHWRYMASLIHTVMTLYPDEDFDQTTNLKSRQSLRIFQTIICLSVDAQAFQEIDPKFLAEESAEMALFRQNGIPILVLPSDWEEFPKVSDDIYFSLDLLPTVPLYGPPKNALRFTSRPMSYGPEVIEPIFDEVFGEPPAKRSKMQDARRISATFPALDLMQEHFDRGLKVITINDAKWISSTTSKGRPLEVAKDIHTKHGGMVVSFQQIGFTKIQPYNAAWEAPQIPKVYRMYGIFPTTTHASVFTTTGQAAGTNCVSEVITDYRGVPFYCQVNWTNLIGIDDVTVVHRICQGIQSLVDLVIGEGVTDWFWISQAIPIDPSQSLRLVRIVIPSIRFTSQKALRHFVATLVVIMDKEIIIHSPDKVVTTLESIYATSQELTLIGNTDLKHHIPHTWKPLDWDPKLLPGVLLMTFPGEDQATILAYTGWSVTNKVGVPKHCNISDAMLMKIPTFVEVFKKPTTNNDGYSISLHDGPLADCMTKTAKTLHPSAYLVSHRLYQPIGTNEPGFKENVTNVFIFKTKEARRCHDGVDHGQESFRLTLGYGGKVWYKCMNAECEKKFIGYPSLDLEYVGLREQQISNKVEKLTQNSKHLNIKGLLGTDGGAVAIRSPQGSGKTTAMIEAAKNYRLTIIIVPRIQLAGQYLQQLTSSGNFRQVKLYSDKTSEGISSFFEAIWKDAENNKTLNLKDGPLAYITTFESLHKLILDWHNVPPEHKLNTMLLIDEAEVEMRSLLSTKTNGRFMEENYRTLKILFKEVGRSFVMDGELSTPTVNWLAQVCPRDVTLLVNNHPGRKRNFILVRNWEKTLFDMLKEGKRCFVGVASLKFGQRLYDDLKKEFKDNLRIQFYHRDADDAIKREMSNANDHWLNYDCIICTNVGSVGLSFDVPDIFHTMFLYLCPAVWNYVEASQITGRVRYPISNDVFVMVSPPYGPCQLDIESTRRFHQNYRYHVLNRFREQLNSLPDGFSGAFPELPEELAELRDVDVQRQVLWNFSPQTNLKFLADDHGWSMELRVEEGSVRGISEYSTVRREVWEAFEVPYSQLKQNAMKLELHRLVVAGDATEAQKLHLNKLEWVDIVGIDGAASFADWEKYLPISRMLLFLRSFLATGGDFPCVADIEDDAMAWQFLELNRTLYSSYVDVINRLLEIFGIPNLADIENHVITEAQLSEAVTYILALPEELLKSKVHKRKMFIVKNALEKLTGFCDINGFPGPGHNHTKRIYKLKWKTISGIKVVDLLTRHAS